MLPVLLVVIIHYGQSARALPPAGVDRDLPGLEEAVPERLHVHRLRWSDHDGGDLVRPAHVVVVDIVRVALWRPRIVARSGPVADQAKSQPVRHRRLSTIRRILPTDRSTVSGATTVTE